MPSPIDIVAGELAYRQQGGASPQGLLREQQYRLREQEAQRQAQAGTLAIENARRLETGQQETARHNRALELLRMLGEQRAAGRSQWDPWTDEEGRQWYIDKTGQQPPRPLVLPSAGGEPAQQRKLQPLTTTELESVRENTQQLEQALKAFNLISGRSVEGMPPDPEATGWKGFVWDPVLQRLDPAGVPTRAAIGNIGSLKIKQRSGGAVPAAEMERLKPFVPRETDDPEVARTKLQGFITEYSRMLEGDIEAYETGGRRVPIPLKEFVSRRVKEARGALGGGSDAAALLKELREELARRRSRQP